MGEIKCAFARIPSRPRPISTRSRNGLWSTCDGKQVVAADLLTLSDFLVDECLGVAVVAAVVVVFHGGAFRFVSFVTFCFFSRFVRT
jgi:hypothetical protein